MAAKDKADSKYKPEKIPHVPKEWPGAFGLYKYSKQAIKPYIWELVLAIVVSYIINILASMFLKNQFLLNLLTWAVSTILVAFTTFIYLAGVRGKTVTAQDTLQRSLPLTPKLFVLILLVYLSFVGSFLLLIVPFFFVLPRLIFAPYYLVDKNMGIMDAYKLSWQRSKGYSKKVWAIIGATFVMVLPFITIIGIPFAIYFVFMYSAATVVLYEFINKQAAK